jgi:hypothetical protein
VWSSWPRPGDPSSQVGFTRMPSQSTFQARIMKASPGWRTILQTSCNQPSLSSLGCIHRCDGGVCRTLAKS